MNLFKSDFCLYCDQEIKDQMGWEEFFLGPKKQPLCQACVNKLVKIEGVTCSICSRPLQKTDGRYIKDGRCLDCIRWESDHNYSSLLEKNYSIYVYNDFLAEVIARFKYRGDYILAKIFAEDIKNVIEKIEFELIVPIPLSEERLKERGFNQAEALVQAAGCTPETNILQRIHTEKQSKKSREERIHLERVFQLSNQAQQIKGKTILVVDDIYTTGSTIRHAAAILKQAGAKKIQSLTLARG